MISTGAGGGGEVASDPLLSTATSITVAWLGNVNTTVDPEQAAGALLAILDALRASGEQAEAAAEGQGRPPSAKMIAETLADPAHIVSLLDGKPYKSLRRHLAVRGISPEDYRQRFGLDPSYPMVSRGYSERRREIAKRAGLGTRLRATADDSAASRQSRSNG